MPQTLHLVRPLVAFDIETTGLDVQNDRIVELCCVKIHMDGARQVWNTRLNPGRPISPEATAVHGIRDADVAQAPPFAEMSARIAEFMAGCDLTGFNVERFDLPLLAAEFRRVGMTFPNGAVHVVDSGKIFWRHEPRDLQGALRFYCGKPLVNAHSAEADAQAAADVLLAQVERYADLPGDVPGLHAWLHPHNPDWIDGEGKLAFVGEEAVITFGKHKNRSLRELATQEPGYLQWICGANFDDAVRKVCHAALGGEFPQRPTPAAGAAAAVVAAAVHTEI